MALSNCLTHLSLSPVDGSDCVSSSDREVNNLHIWRQNQKQKQPGSGSGSVSRYEDMKETQSEDIRMYCSIFITNRTFKYHSLSVQRQCYMPCVLI